MDGKNWITVAGVAGDVKEFGLGQISPDQVYVPMAILPSVGAILVRAIGDPRRLSLQVRQAILGVDPQIAINRLETLAEVRSESMSSARIAADLTGMFSSLALIIAVTGLGSMLALSVGQRTREIAIRMSFGASVSAVSRAIVGQGLLLVGIGLAAGFAASLAITRFLSSVLFQTSPTDLFTFVLITALFVATP